MAVAQRNDILSAARSTARAPLKAPRPRPDKESGLAWFVYILFAAAVVLEQYYSSELYPEDIGRYLPFFEDVATWTGIKGLSFSLGEIFMSLALIALLLKVVSTRGFRFDRGSLLRPLGLYMLMVLVGEIHGLITGGNRTLSLWEVRGQVYMLVAYLLPCNLIKTRRGVTALVWIIVIGTGVKALQGLYRWQVDLAGNIHTVESLFPHEQSFFFNGLLLLTITLFLYGGSRRLKGAALFLLPFVLIVDLANQRRAAVLGIVVGIAALFAVTAIIHPARRRVVIAIAVMLAIAWTPYYAAFKNSTGLTGEIAHAVNSNTHPDPRDASSNLYRDNENADIMYTMKSNLTSQIIGVGYGKHMDAPYPLAQIDYIFWDIMPHNSVLWVWMRLGTAGYLLFWILIGTAIVQAMRVARRLTDPYLKGLAVWIGIMVMQQVIFGYLDLQWTSYRNLVTMGILFALIGRLGQLGHREAAPTALPRTDDNVPPPAHDWARRPDLPRALSVIDGRLSHKIKQ